MIKNKENLNTENIDLEFKLKIMMILNQVELYEKLVRIYNIFNLILLVGIGIGVGITTFRSTQSLDLFLDIGYLVIMCLSLLVLNVKTFKVKKESNILLGKINLDRKTYLKRVSMRGNDLLEENINEL